jgi:hypothetical protein
MLGYESLANYYKTNFSLLHHHKYSLQEFDEMIPWEKQIYIKMLTDHIKEQNEKLKQLQMQRNTRR